MSLIWKYKIDLNKSFSWIDIENSIGSKVPDELKNFIEENNAASPSKNRIVINGMERVFETVLSFNSEEIDATTFNSVYYTISSKSMIPFAMDPFGNCFCYSVVNRKIAFYLHEEDRIEFSDYSLGELLDTLY